MWPAPHVSLMRRPFLSSLLIVPGILLIASASLEAASPRAPKRQQKRQTASRAFLTAPLPWPVQGPVISAFARPRPGRRHHGVDIKCSEGTPIRAVADGVATLVKERYGSYGRLVVIQHDNGMVSYYGHNAKNLVSEGERVEAEQVIALVGRSGNATGDHLHFEIRVQGKPIDPLQALASLPVARAAPAASGSAGGSGVGRHR